MNAYLSKHALSDHVRREKAKEDAANFCAFAIVGLLAFAFVVGLALSAFGV